MIEPLHNHLDETRATAPGLQSWRECDHFARKKMRVFWAVFLIAIAFAWTLFWLCASVTVYDSDFFELKNFEIIFFLLMMLGLAPLAFGIRLLEPEIDW